jgi:hypothetical protein
MTWVAKCMANGAQVCSMASRMSRKQCEIARKKTKILFIMRLDHARAQYAQYRAKGYPWTTRWLT